MAVLISTPDAVAGIDETHETAHHHQDRENQSGNRDEQDQRLGILALVFSVRLSVLGIGTEAATMTSRGVVAVNPTKAKSHPWLLAGISAMLLLSVGSVGVWLTIWPGSQGPCGPFPQERARIAPFARGEVAALKMAPTPEPAPPLAFENSHGRGITLADFRGRTVLLNLWATWCEPCRREMPALNRLQAELGSPRFEVVAINIDTRNLNKPKAWLLETGVSGLAYYSDPEAKVFQDLREAGQAEGMPTTLLIDAHGCRLGTMGGPAEWSSPDGLALIQAALGS